MDRFPKFCTIHIEGKLHERWKDWFGEMTVSSLNNREVLIQGVITDQSALVGMINQIHNLNLELISVNCERIEEEKR